MLEMGTSTMICHTKTAKSSPPLFQNGKLVLQTHHVGRILAGFFAFLATVTSIWLVDKHLQWYTNKREQRYIVRILFMVPVYALVSFASFLFWNHSTALTLIRDGYESTVLTAFFYLLLMYLSPNAAEQRSIFLKAGLSREADIDALTRNKKPKRWVFPLGFIKWKPKDGLYFLQLMKWGVLQYCVIRPTTTLIAVILNYLGLYCEESWGLGWGHIYITVTVSVSVTIAMYCLIQLYVSVAANLAPHKPLLKLFAIKAVVFLTFWQATFLSVLSMLGVVKDTTYMTASDVNIGIGALLETFEMMLFAVLHIHAFTYKTYRPFHTPASTEPPPGRTPRLRSLMHAVDFRETFREIWMGLRYISDKMVGREPAIDVGPRRIAHYEEAFGRSRAVDRLGGETERLGKKVATSPALEIEVEEEVDVDIEGERQWLGLGDNYAYGLEYFRREKSDGLEEQIQRELERRGYGIWGLPTVMESDQNKRRPRSWWHRMYEQISEHGSKREEDQSPRFDLGAGINDPPPPSLLRDQPNGRGKSTLGTSYPVDVLALPPVSKDVSIPWSRRMPSVSVPRLHPVGNILEVYPGTSSTIISHSPPIIVVDSGGGHGDVFQGSTVNKLTELTIPTEHAAPALSTGPVDELNPSLNTQQMLVESRTLGKDLPPKTHIKYRGISTPPTLGFTNSPLPMHSAHYMHRRESAFDDPSVTFPESTVPISASITATKRVRSPRDGRLGIGAKHSRNLRPFKVNYMTSPSHSGDSRQETSRGSGLDNLPALHRSSNISQDRRNDLNAIKRY